MSALVIARLTFREASRRWVLWAALLLGIIFLVVFTLGFREIHLQFLNQYGSERNVGRENLFAIEAYNMMTMAGLYVVNFLTVIMAVLTSVDTLSGEISTGTIHTLVSKPVRRWEIVIGKWLGFAGMLTLYQLLMGGGVLASIRIISGYTPPNVATGMFLLWVNMLMMLGVSMAGGAVLSTLANGVLVLGLYGIAFIGGWIEQIGSFLNNDSAVTIGIVSSLIIPSEALWKRATYEMASPLATAFGFSPFVSTNSVPSPLMVGYAIFYAAGALGLAIYLFRKRDL